jgi:SPP1 gp7 family putative phage head morphogenesis protein
MSKMALPALTPSERHEAALRVSLIIKAVEKARSGEKESAAERLRRQEKVLAAELSSQWRKVYEDKLKELFQSIPGNITEDAKALIEDGILSALGPAFGNSRLVRNTMKRYIEKAYSEAKQEWVPAVPENKDSPLLSLSDRRAIDVLTRHNCFWLGEHYGEHIGPKISELTQRALDEGMGRKALAEELKRELGGVAPKDYRYWDVASSAALVRARSFGTISGMEEAGITEYEVLAMGDERMCPICGEMNGRVFSVSDTRGVINSALSLTDPKEFKAAMPWQSKPATGISNFKLCADGQSLPPFHGRCRCTLIMTGKTSDTHSAKELEYNHILDPVDMPVQKGEPMEINKAQEGTNPDFSKGFEYQYNCQRCVPAYELRRRGYDVESMPVDLKKLKGKNLDSLAVAPESIFVDKDGLRLKPNQLLTTAEGQELKKKLKDELSKINGDARFEIQVAWKRKNGHVFVAEKQGDDISFIDPQDTSSRDIDWTKVKRNGVKYWRIDNAKFNPDMPISGIIKEKQK